MPFFGVRKKDDLRLISLMYCTHFLEARRKKSAPSQEIGKINEKKVVTDKKVKTIAEADRDKLDKKFSKEKIKIN